MEDGHAREHGEITATLKTLEKAVDDLSDDVRKLGNGKTVDLIKSVAIAVLGLLELQARTGIEIGTTETPAAFVKVMLAFVSRIGG